MRITEKHVEDFIAEKKRQEVAENTLKAYSRDVETLYDFMNGREVTQESMQEYRQHLESKYKLQSVHRKIRTANQFISFFGDEAAKVKNVKLIRNEEIEVMTPADLKRLLRWADKLHRPMEKAIMETLVSTGIRFGELQYITVEAVKAGYATVCNKGARRNVAIPKQLKQLLKAYCKEAGIESGMIFKTRNGTPISNPQLSRVLKRIAGAARVNKKKIHPHAFRHLFAVNFLERGGNVLDLRDILGHMSLETTAIYTRVTTKQMSRKMANTCILDTI